MFAGGVEFIDAPPTPLGCAGADCVAGVLTREKSAAESEWREEVRPRKSTSFHSSICGSSPRGTASMSLTRLSVAPSGRTFATSPRSASLRCRGTRRVRGSLTGARETLPSVRGGWHRGPTFLLERSWTTRGFLFHAAFERICRFTSRYNSCGRARLARSSSRSGMVLPANCFLSGCARSVHISQSNANGSN